MTSRRKFLTGAATTGLAATAINVLPPSIRRALAIPANNKTGTIQDIEHIVILMQENRSFDHYFGTLKGVRGFGDPRPIALPNGRPIWYQPDESGSYVLPYHPGVGDLGFKFIDDLNHNWNGGHQAWNKGRHDAWIPAKGIQTMVHMTREDIPFHYALADAFTICDGYHCSLLGPTDPNRYYMFSGCCGNDGTGGATGGPDISNGETGNYSWTTYPERLEAARISWKVYQDIGGGLDAGGGWGWNGSKPYIGNYGDNSLLYFKQYRAAKPGDALYDKARTGTEIARSGTLFDQLKADVANNTLPQVSWIAAPEAYTEHPNWPANGGAWYIDHVLQALTSNPEVWSKTALFVTYDEDGGWFDHTPTPFAPFSNNQGLSTVSIANEYHTDGLPFGLGVRVPMLVISPWSKGGWVNSQVFDHTSLVRFIEARFGVREDNISPWRRAVCGDLTSAFDFAAPDSMAATFPATIGYEPPTTNRSYYTAQVPDEQKLPRQEPGQRPARPVPYELFVHGRSDVSASKFWLDFGNTGGATAAFHVYTGNGTDGPWVYTVGTGKKLSDYWSTVATKDVTKGIYDLSVYGANGFLRRFVGDMSTTAGVAYANPEVAACYDITNRNIRLTLRNSGNASCRMTVANSYGSAASRNFTLGAGASIDDYWDLSASDGWYDLSVTADIDDSFLRRFAGHVENGKPSKSDPKLGLEPPAVIPAPQRATLKALKASITKGSTLDFSYSVPDKDVDAKNWIGVFSSSLAAPVSPSLAWQYAPNAKGQITMGTDKLNAGTYKAWFLAKDGYGFLAGPVDFTVT
ncbi:MULTISPECIES: phospholipase C, phosphocholine-specific [unclassified Variovorax]|jgi:phospholipase C|uniref:phosphocholine-specific phospholipase C n=2 Tax=Variovorax TaxID=34072 RepID=UPI000F7DF0CE|nr:MULTISPECIES: phospholipase C, phosphocholine-specific [unclassified Variovorax]RSZ44249.1 phospholipase C, phosphocholine-specific [Variovorax sp. 553]RSZ45095.1 phospholipase C, phosphocholine-specific [Variovorax sp. 679]